MVGRRRNEVQKLGARKRQRLTGSSQGGSVAADTATSLGGVAVFKDACVQLRKKGWSAKPPSSKSLDSRYRYVRPGGDPKGQEGVDFLLGEFAVLQFVSAATGVLPMELPAHTGPTDVTVITSGDAASGNGGARAVGGGGRAAGDSDVQARGGGDCDSGGVHAAGGRDVQARGGGDSDGSAGGVVITSGGAASGNGGARAVGGGGRAAGDSDVQARGGGDCDSGGVHAAGGRDVQARRGGRGSRGGHAAGGSDVQPCRGGRDNRGRSAAGDDDAQANGGGRGDGQLEATVSTTPTRVPQRNVVSPSDVTPARTPPVLLQDVYVDRLVAFSPEKSVWMKAKVYRPIGTAYIVGRVCRQVKKGKFASLFQVRWLDSQFQSAVEHLSVGAVQLGIKTYVALTRIKNPDWHVLTEPDSSEAIEVGDAESDLVAADDLYEAFDASELLPTSLDEVEAIRSMRFEPSAHVEAPSYLYEHADGTTKTYLRPEYKHLFDHSASSSFFAYLPLYFWRQVLHETNRYAALKEVKTSTPFTLSELMAFLGIMFFMAVNEKGEYANYWGPQPEDLIFGGATTSLDIVMTLNRFKLLRRCLSFNATPTTLEKDAAAHIRPLLNLLKITGGQYVNVGRDVALDEASVACRSRQGRHLIVYNPLKPTGKYHFRLYMICCSSTWISLNYRLHCNQSDISDRLHGVIGQVEAQDLREELEKVSKIRQHVLEVARPFFGSNRVLNMDNYYTSVQLLQELRLKGLYARGTIRANSKHFPSHTILHKDDCVRGDHRQAVSSDHSMLAASWCDGNVVNMVSNADASTTTTVNRMIGNERRAFSAPVCVARYNRNMQGVDRLDQIRGRFSIADGHSYKRWHKKLALALIDVARSNAYLTRRLAKPDSTARDPHRAFVTELVAELINGQWAEAPSEGRMLYTSRNAEEEEDASAHACPVMQTESGNRLAVSGCASVASKQIYAERNRKRRSCIVCRWEGRYPTEVTNYCVTHSVCLCRVVHVQAAKPWMCPQIELTCWEKFHQFYEPQSLFTDKGNIRRHSQLTKLRQDASQIETSPTAKPGAARQIHL